MSRELNQTETGGVAESGYYPALIETARIVNVNVLDWSIDLVTEYANKRFFDIQWMSPYLHYANGEGIYVMPEVGATCWICRPSAGKLATPFVLGFKTEIDERDVEGGVGPALNFRANRQTLNPGDMMMKTRDENFVILRRGGVVQIGATPTAQRLYVPIGNLIRDMCQGYLLQSFGGDMEWCVDRTDQSSAGDTKTSFRLRSKVTAADPEHAVFLTCGSHPDDDNLRLSLIVRPDGAEGSTDVVSLTMDKDGTVTWQVEKDFLVTSGRDVALTAGRDINLIAGRAGTLEVENALSIKSNKASVSLEAKGAASMKGASATVEGTTVTLKGKTAVGGVGGEPLIKGQSLVAILNQLIQGLYDASNPHGPANTAPGFPVLLPVVAKLQPQLLAKTLSQNTVT
jgi:hypothetical protein